MRRFLAILFAFAITFSFVEAYASFDVSAESAVLIDYETGRIIYEKNANVCMPMASTTKIITAITAIENGNLSDIVTVSANAAMTEGSSVWLSEGEKLTLEELLYALMLESGNDAAVAIAEHIGGSEENFAKLMNEVCEKIGTKSTNCVTASGLDDEFHYTTAYDLAKITRYAMSSDTFREIVATYKTTIPWEGNEWDRTLVNHNKLLNIYQGADGVKTGYTKKSGRCLVSSAEKDGWRVIAVTLNAPDDWNDHVKMLDYAFESCAENVILVNCGVAMGKICTPASKTEFISFGVSEKVTVKKLTEKIDLKIVYNTPKEIYTTIKAGDKVGTADIFLNGIYYKTVDMISFDEAKRDSKKYIIYENFSKLLKTLLYLVR